MYKAKLFVLGSVLAIGGLSCVTSNQEARARRSDDNTTRLALEEPRPKQISAERLESPERLISEFDVGDARLRWTTSDVYLVGASGKETSLFLSPLKETTDVQIKRIKQNLSDLQTSSEVEFYKNRTHLEFRTGATVSMRSLVGPIVSFEISHFDVLEGGPADGTTWLLTLDLRKKGPVMPFSEPDIENETCNRMVSLTELFAENDLVSAVIAIESVGKLLDSRGQKKVPTSIRELFEIGNSRYGIDMGNNEYLSEYSFKHFTFDRIENGRVILKVALIKPGIVGTENVSLIEISLPIPDRLRDAILAASVRTRGFLGKASHEVSGGSSSELLVTKEISLK